MFDITPEEKHLLEQLAVVWEEFCRLPLQNPLDAQEFITAIRSLQNMVAARSAYRRLQLEKQSRN